MSRRSKWGGGYNRKVNILLATTSVLLFALLLFFLYMEDQRQKEVSAYLSKIAEEERAERKAEEERLAAVEASDSFYQKLRDGFDVNILIVGDSIGVPSDETSWAAIVSSTLRRTYRNKVRFTNVSMGGNSSYAGYVRVNALDDDIDYDLAILCYGQNDRDENFDLYYESMIRAIYQKYEDCSIISILESSQREYTEKMQKIQEIAGYYDIPVVDTIAAFNNSEYEYEELSDDGVHPNDIGKQIYAETLLSAINECVDAERGYDSRPEAYVDGVEVFDTFTFVSADEFTVIDDRTVEINISMPSTAILGIDYTYLTGEQRTEIYIDGTLFLAPTVTFDYDHSVRYILVMAENCGIEENIKIVFENAEALEGFYGLAFSNID